MNTPIQLIQAMFDGTVAAAQGVGRAIEAGFKSVLYGVVESSEGVVTYGTTYTDLATFLMTFAGIGLATAVVFFFVNKLRHGRG